MRQWWAAVPTEGRREALCRREIEASCEFLAPNPFEVRALDVHVRRVAGARGLATTPAVAMRELEKRRSHAISNGATETTARQHFAAHSRASVSSMPSNVELTRAEHNATAKSSASRRRG